jgi:hypothetical protein
MRILRLGIALVLFSAACAPHRVKIGATGPRRAIAVVKVITSTGVRLESIDGTRVASPAEVQLGPGEYTLGVGYAHQKNAAAEPLTFDAEAGHLYELSAASPEVAGGRWTPVLVDDSTQTQLYPKK